MRTTLAILLALLVAHPPASLCPLAAGDPPQLQVPADDQVLAASTRLRPGVWNLPDAGVPGVLLIRADNTVLDLGGSTLDGAAPGCTPDQFQGVGIWIQDAQNVVIRNGSIRGYKVGIHARNCPGLVIQDIDGSDGFRQRLQSTPEREAPADWLWPHHNESGEWEAKYGGAISLVDCQDARVLGCRARNGQNGVLLTRCTRCRVLDGDFSFNSGWGIALYRSSDCEVSHNRCDACVRGYSHGVYARGQDSAAILLFEQCSGNVIARNSCTHSGDGLFLYAGHETTQRTGVGGSNRNLVFKNDFSHSVANAIEATFSVGNVFVENVCDDSDHGIWAGYSSETMIAGNHICGCTTAGVSIEHGQLNKVLFNTIQGGRAGVHLWWDEDPEFVKGPFGAARATSSSENLLEGNDISGADTGIRLVGDARSVIRWNHVGAREACIHLGAETQETQIAHNFFQGARAGAAPPQLLTGPDRTRSGPAENEGRGRFASGSAWDPALLAHSAGLVRPPLRLPPLPTLHGSAAPTWPKDLARGRSEIRIDEWGPVPPGAVRLFPKRVLSVRASAQFSLLGEGPFSAQLEGKGLVVTPKSGSGPVGLRVESEHPLSPGEPGELRPFQLRVRTAAGVLESSGALLITNWHVAWFEWSTDPREDVAAWDHLLQSEPVATLHSPALDFAWGSAGPTGVRPDRFATRARTRLTLPAGSYRLRVVSDDGVRVSVDGQRVLENWTHHAPTEDQADLELSAGVHELEVLHFELDGWAQLTLSLEPLSRSDPTAD